MSEPIELEGVLAVRETARALLIRTATGEQHWVPKSVIHEDSEVYQDGDGGKLIIAAWFAEKEGIE